MDFYAHQRRARRTTLRLVVLFALALLCFVGALYAATVIALRLFGAWQGMGAWWDPAVLAAVAAATTAVLGAAAWRRSAALAAQGGAAVATLVGGRPVHHLTASLAERTLLNVVEEMAVAASLPVPWVYVLDAEPGINAFTAGYRPERAVVVVTAGALHALTRDELQGMMAHEFSHILGGDMRLNTRLLGLLSGLQFFGKAGRWLIRLPAYLWPGEDRIQGCLVVGTKLAFLIVLTLFFYAAGYATMAWLSVVWIPIPIAGAVLALLAGFGALFSQLIQRAVARQRELLADAAAVQFTRYPDGLAGSLRKIDEHPQGGRIFASAAPQLGHFFFAAASPPSLLTSLLESHPPLVERLRRLAAWHDAGEVPPERHDADAVLGRPAMPSAHHLAYGHAVLERLPEALYAAAHEPDGAEALVYGLLLDADEAVLRRQFAALDGATPPAVLELLRDLLPDLRQLTAAAYLPLLEILLPALRRLAPDRLAAFRRTLQALAAADAHLSTFEFALYLLLKHWLPAAPAPHRDTIAIGDLRVFLPDCVVLLSALAYLHRQEKGAWHAFEVARLYLPAGQPPLALLPRAHVTPRAVETALDRLRGAAQPVRRQVVDACVHAVLADGAMSAKEAELLRVVAVLLNCPLPPFLPAVAPDLYPTGTTA